jgi:hypothetical protein
MGDDVVERFPVIVTETAKDFGDTEFGEAIGQVAADRGGTACLRGRIGFGASGTVP